MTSQEIWVHGTSGHLQIVDEDWGWAKPEGWGLYMEGNVRNDSPKGEPWVQFHIPMPFGRYVPDAASPLITVAPPGKPAAPPDEEPRVEIVMLRFRTDCNPANPNPPYQLQSKGWEKWVTDAGGAIVRHVHVYDGDVPLEEFNDLDWQSPNIDTSIVRSVAFSPPRKIQWGLGLSVRVWFKNQCYVEKRRTLDPNDAYAAIADDWDQKPWVNEQLATDSKKALLVSVGCRFTTSP